eukprot:PLAT12474.1.p3 GENE.PLAT12474.1~~PLAT12474.1.p3  ORF type:complete len:124 (-),score=8.86 PLAT12474.1:114-485(-)
MASPGRSPTAATCVPQPELLVLVTTQPPSSSSQLGPSSLYAAQDSGQWLEALPTGVTASLLMRTFWLLPPKHTTGCNGPENAASSMCEPSKLTEMRLPSYEMATTDPLLILLPKLLVRLLLRE